MAIPLSRSPYFDEIRHIDAAPLRTGDGGRFPVRPARHHILLMIDRAYWRPTPPAGYGWPVHSRGARESKETTDDPFET